MHLSSDSIYSSWNVWCNVGQSHMITCGHMFAIIAVQSWRRQNGEDWVWLAIARCAYFTLVKSVLTLPYRDLGHRINLTYLCKLLRAYCHTWLPATLHQEANVRQLFSPTLRQGIDVHGMCTCQALCEEILSRGSQTCDHCKGQSLVVTYSYANLSISTMEESSE